MNFNDIPANQREPFFFLEMDNSQANYTLQNKRSLHVGQKLAGAPAPVLTGVAILVPNADYAKSWFGIGSMLARMVEKHRKQDPYGELWCIALADNGAGAAATGTLTITGPATASGTIPLYIAGQSISVGVTSGDAQNAIAAAVNAAINAATDLPVTSTVATNVVTPLCRWKGATGNDIQMMDSYRGSAGGEALPAGVGITYSGSNFLTGGTTDPSVAAAITAMGDEEYDYVIHPYALSANLDLWQTEFNQSSGRWAWSRQIYGHCYTAMRGTLNALVTAGGARNDAHHTIAGFEVDTPSPCWEFAAAYGGRNAACLNADIIKSTQTTDLVDILPPRSGKRFIGVERQSLLNYGIATSYHSGGMMHISRAITTYQKNALGLADLSYLDSETMHKLTDFNRELRALCSKYSRHALADDGTEFDSGLDILTPNVFFGEYIGMCKRMARQGKLENVKLIEKYSIAVRDPANPNRLNVYAAPDLTNHVRTIAVRNAFRNQFPIDA